MPFVSYAMKPTYLLCLINSPGKCKYKMLHLFLPYGNYNVVQAMKPICKFIYFPTTRIHLEVNVNT